MKYTGLQGQISKNNRKSVLLLMGFPALILAATYAGVFFTVGYEDSYETNIIFLETLPIVIAVVGVWFLIAFASHSALIKLSTGAQSLERKDNMRIYNLTENLCMSVGMKMPQLFVIESDALNAFASGINEKTYAVTLTRGIIEKLDDKELEGVIAHELTHIRNRDVRLLIISIIFVGIFGFIVQVLFRSLLYGGRSRNNKKVDGRVMLIALAIGIVVYLLSVLFKFALSRNREYLADAGAVEMTKDPMAMAGALRKISGNSELETKSSDMKQAFIENGPKKEAVGISGWFATHPPIEKRIAFLEQM